MTAETRQERRQRRRQWRKEWAEEAAGQTGCCLFEALAAAMAALVLLVLPSWLWLR